MKQITKKISLFLLTILSSIVLWAQDKDLKVDIDVNKNDNWYQQPWIWIVGAAVFILLLVAVLKGSGKKTD